MELNDPTNGTSEPTRFWSTANIGEATPDVLSAMCWSFWGPYMEAGGRLAYHDFGILPASELGVPSDPNDLLTSHFYGRPAMNLDRLRTLFNAIPGMSADDFERDVCGTVREGLPTEPAGGRTLHVLRRGPAAMVTAGRKIRALVDEQRRWWETQVFDAAADPAELLPDSAARFREAFRAHVRGRFVLMSLQAQLTKLATDAGRPDLVVRLLGGLGGVAETDVADDLWSVGHGRMAIGDFVRRHGFHGPNEGNVASTSWREDTAAIEKLATAMAARGEDNRPRTREAVQMAARAEAMGELLAALPATKRPVAKWLAGAAGRAVQTNEIGKSGFLMALDGGRAATRALGRRHVDAGTLEQPDDAFCLTIDELLAPLPDDVMALVRFRRERREEFRRYELPGTFHGVPEPILLDDAGAGASAGSADDPVVVGVAGAPGSAKGTARVVVDPDDAEPLEPGEVLVCRFTDPSWAPLFSLADALVIDIGAAASHGAIVARELGVPCVIGTGDGTRRIHTGDVVAVDGDAGRVEILERAVTGAR